MVGNYILSFIGFLPADNPEVVVYIAIDNPKGVTQYGGTVSAPIAKNVLLASIDALDIEPRDDGMEKEYQYGTKKYATVSNVIGLSANEAVKQLKEFKVEFSGSGNIVTYQSPKAGSMIYEGETIKLLLKEE